MPVALLTTSLVLGAAAAPARAPAQAGSVEKVSPMQRQWSIAASGAMKLEVRRDGWYRVTRSRLARAGAKLSSSRSPRLFADGKEVPIYVSAGAIEFYGLARDTPSTDTRTYWLVDGAARGSRIPVTSAGSERRSGFARSFPFTLDRKYRTIYSTLPNGERQNYFGDQIYSSPTTLHVTVQNLARGSGSLDVVVQGLTRRSHSVQVVLNGAALGTMTLSELANVSHHFPLRRGLLHEGQNSLTLTSTGGATDVSFIDTVELTYPRQYRAERGELRFAVPAGAAAKVTGFNRRNVILVDVTRPRSPRLLQPTVSRTQDGYAAVVAPAQHARRFLALTKPLAPARVVRDRPSSWHRGGDADLVIIGYHAFLPQLARLQRYHERQGLKVTLVDVEDLYDEFSFGAHDPDAIKAFLARARQQWRPAPRYVILAGDATSDPRNYLRDPARDFVPTKTVDTRYLETASDDWFADFDGDGVPEMAVGRLPVRTAAEAATVVDKIIGYEEAPAPTSREALLVSDNGFEAATDLLRPLLPPATTAVTVNRSDGPTDAAVHDRILNALNRGPSIVNYYGHGAVDIWTGADLLKSADATSLRNAGGLSLFMMMTCLNGYFIEPRTQSLAEALLRAPHGGAFAVWASSGLTVPADQIRANEELVRQLAATQSPRLGDAMVRTKSVITDPDVRRTWILFGDPLTHLR